MEVKGIFMKIDPQLLKFPMTLPNDLEGFIFYYPPKFPQIVPYFEEIAGKIGVDSKAYQEYGHWAHDEMFAGFEKIKKDYEAGNQEDLEFLVSIDQRFHKLFCYRFWVVNYLFADGPLHDFYVDNLKNFIRKFVDVTEDIEDFENKVIRIQRDLLQSDYADLYLRQALSGVEIVRLLKENPKTKPLVDQAINLINQDPQENIDEINQIWDKIAAIVMDKQDKSIEPLRKELWIPLEQVEMRKTMLPLYNMLTHAVEFREENESLTKRYEEMGNMIKNYMGQARQKLSTEEFELFELSYQQARNFSMYKDVMGEIDPYLLPVWFGLHDKVKKILSKNKKFAPRSTGHSAMFYFLVWHLPNDLKAKVMTPDPTPFSLETL